MSLRFTGSMAGSPDESVEGYILPQFQPPEGGNPSAFRAAASSPSPSSMVGCPGAHPNSWRKRRFDVRVEEVKNPTACRPAASRAGRLSRHALQLFFHPSDGLLPVPEPPLPEEAHGGVPGGVLPLLHPPPVGDEGQQRPDRPAHRPGEVGGGGVHRDEKVQALQDRCGGGKILQLAAQILDPVPEAEAGDLPASLPRLEAEEADPLRVEQRGEPPEGDGPVPVVGVGGVPRPDEAHFEAGDLRDPAADRGRVRRGAQVGDLGGDGLPRGSVQKGKAHQGGVKVERGEGLPLRADGPDPGGGGQERLQAGLAFEDHLCAQPGDPLRVADELEGVADPLLDVEQNGFSPGGRSVPGGLRKILLLRPEAVGLPARFVPAEPGGEISPEEEGEGEVEIGQAEVRVDGERASVDLHGLLQPPPHEVGVSEAGDGLGVVGPERHRPPVRGQGLLQPPQGLERVSPVVVGVNEVRPEVDRPLVGGQRLLGPALFLEGGPAQVVGVRVVRLELDCPLEGGQGLGGPPQVPAGASRKIMGLGAVRPEGDHPPEGGQGLLRLPLIEEEGPQVLVRRFVFGMGRRDALERRPRLAGAAPFPEGGGQVVLGFREVRREGDRPLEGGGGLLQPALLEERVSEVLVVLCLPGVGADGPGDVLGRRAVPSRLKGRQAQEVVRLGVVRVGPEDFAIPLFRLLEATRLVVREGFVQQEGGAGRAGLLPVRFCHSEHLTPGEFLFRRAGHPLQVFLHLPERPLPVPDPLLAEQAHGGVPGRVLPVEHPAPVGGEGEQGPDRLPHRAREMGGGGVHRDEKVQPRDDRGGGGEVRQRAAEVLDAPFQAGPGDLLPLLPHLEAEETDALRLEDRFEFTQGD